MSGEQLLTLKEARRLTVGSVIGFPGASVTGTIVAEGGTFVQVVWSNGTKDFQRRKNFVKRAFLIHA